jgi:hypothetical protein
MTSGYSSTPLAKKLGIKAGAKILLHNQPENYLTLFTDFPADTAELTDIKSETADFIHIFCTSTDEIETAAEKYKPMLKKSGMMWISWPKGSSAISTNLNRDFIREYMLDNGLVDVKVAAIDEDWSGLKFVYRLKDR